MDLRGRKFSQEEESQPQGDSLRRGSQPQVDSSSRRDLAPAMGSSHGRRDLRGRSSQDREPQPRGDSFPQEGTPAPSGQFSQERTLPEGLTPIPGPGTDTHLLSSA